jgi:hypothetical protein
MEKHCDNVQQDPFLEFLRVFSGLQAYRKILNNAFFGAASRRQCAAAVCGG